MCRSIWQTNKVTDNTLAVELQQLRPAKPVTLMQDASTDTTSEVTPAPQLDPTCPRARTRLCASDSAASYVADHRPLATLAFAVKPHELHLTELSRALTQFDAVCMA